VLNILALVLLSLFVLGTAQAASPQVLASTCTNPITTSEIALKGVKDNCAQGDLPAIWHLIQPDSPHRTGDGFKTLRICTSKSLFNYQFIRSKCPFYQVTSDYYRTVSAPVTPAVLQSFAISPYQIHLVLAATPSSDSPIAYYLVKNLTSNATKKVSISDSNNLYINGLEPATSYLFSITAVNIDGIATNSFTSQEVSTRALPIKASVASGSSDATLASLSVTSASLSPAFSSGTYSYTSTVAHSVSSMRVTPTINESHATISVNGTPVASGSQSGSISLNTGSNTISVLVTAQNGATQTYVLTITRNASGVFHSSIVAGVPTQVSDRAAYSGEVATDVHLGSPIAVTMDGIGNTYIADRRNGVLKVGVDGTISTVLRTQNGSAWSGSLICGTNTDGSLATNFTVNTVRGIASDNNGNIFVTDGKSCFASSTYVGSGVYEILGDGSVHFISGGMGEGFADGNATTSQLNNPRGIAIDQSGAIYVADKYNNRIRKVVGGITTTIAGTGSRRGFDTETVAARANVDYPYGIAVDNVGNVYFTETYLSDVRKIDASGNISTIAGMQGHYSCTDGPGLSATFGYPKGLTVDGAGNVYVSDEGCNTIRKIDASGNVTTVLGDGTGSYAVGTSPSTVEMNQPYGAWVSQDGSTLVVADTGNNIVRKFDGLP